MIWFLKIIRTFFFQIDYIIYNFIIIVYDLIMQVSRTTLLSQGDILAFAQRIESLLAVFMLFKVSFSIITYIINPDEFSDKSKGFGKIWQNAIISLLMLVLVPYAFNMAYEFQHLVLKDNALMTLLFGDDLAAKNGENSYSNFTNSGGQLLAYSIAQPFLVPASTLYSSAVDMSPCINFIDDSGNFNEICKAILTAETSGGVGLNNDKDAIVINNYAEGVNKKNFGLFFRLDAIKFTTTGNTEFVFDYKLILSTAVGVIVLLVLVSFLLDVALRSVKLTFLQFIAPIPIISFMDPKSGKDGIFKKWYQMCFSTYLSLFIRLFGLYFGIYLIFKIVQSGPRDFLTGTPVNNFLINVILIIGILFFVKQLPKILEGLGIKLDGGGKFTLNPFKKIENEAAGGKQILGAGAALGAGALAGASNVGTRLFDKNNKWRDEKGNLSFKRSLKNVGRAFGSGVAGATSATFRGFRKTAKGEKPGKIFSDSYGEAMFSKILREDNLRKAGLEDASLGERIQFGAGSIGADVARHLGILNKGQLEYLEADKLDKDIKSKQDLIAESKQKQANLRNDSHVDILEKARNISKNLDSIIDNNGDVKKAKSIYENAKQRGASDDELDRLYDSYKLQRSIALDDLSRTDSTVQSQVDLYNSYIDDYLSKGGTASVKKISTNVSVEVDRSSADVIEVNGQSHKIMVDATTHTKYYIDSTTGRRIDESYWSTSATYHDSKAADTIIVNGESNKIMKDATSGVRYYIDATTGIRVDESYWDPTATYYDSSAGFKAISKNDDLTTNAIIDVETSQQYRDYDAEIKKQESEIEDIKTSDAYIRSHDENSRAKLENASRFNKQTQQPGYKPASGPAQGTPFRGLYNPPSSGGGTPPSPPPPGGGPGPTSP